MNRTRHLHPIRHLACVGHCWQLAPSRSPDNQAGDSNSTDMGPVADWLSFQRIVGIPSDACIVALDSWQLTGRDGQLHLGNSLLRGPIERDPHLGSCQIEARLARGPLRPPVRMRLEVDHWSANSTALVLIPCQRVRPSAIYFRAGHCLLDCLIHMLLAQSAGQQRLGCRAASQPSPHSMRPIGHDRTA